ncbi:MAG TPA: winged helix DNA-binding protein [Puia sp.]|nr:winged helix DNA-binding protein [Puia sp.]
MSALTELITAWEEYTATHPDNISVKAFCDNFLFKPTIADEEETSFSLARIIARLAAIQRACFQLALRDLPGIEPEWYYFLNTIKELYEVRKTDVISINLFLEPSTGIDILNRMIKAGLLKEDQDPEDRRARLLRLTAKGEIILKKAEEKIRIAVDMLYPPRLTILWNGIDTQLGFPQNKFGELLIKNRPKTLEELLTLAK